MNPPETRAGRVPGIMETFDMTEHQGLPVAGYRPQSDMKVAVVNANKEHEERILRVLDRLAEQPDVDKRWLAIGRTAIENGFMAVNRAVFQPGRVALPEDHPGIGSSP